MPTRPFFEFAEAVRHRRQVLLWVSAAGKCAFEDFFIEISNSNPNGASLVLRLLDGYAFDNATIVQNSNRFKKLSGPMCRDVYEFKAEEYRVFAFRTTDGGIVITYATNKSQTKRVDRECVRVSRIIEQYEKEQRDDKQNY